MDIVQSIMDIRYPLPEVNSVGEPPGLLPATFQTEEEVAAYAIQRPRETDDKTE